MSTKKTPIQPAQGLKPLSCNAAKEDLWDHLCETALKLQAAQECIMNGESYLQGYKAAVELICDGRRDNKALNYERMLEGFTDAVKEIQNA